MVKFLVKTDLIKEEFDFGPKITKKRVYDLVSKRIKKPVESFSLKRKDKVLPHNSDEGLFTDDEKDNQETKPESKASSQDN